jgi:DNA-binding MarR family transcriptional regulator
MAAREARWSAVPEAWLKFVRTHAAITRQMDADLIALHDLTLSDYEVLLRLYEAPENRMRRVDLAESVVLTQSGITRLLAGLETAGLVDRASCDTDRRVVYAQLTDQGREKFRAAGRTHLDGIRSLFADRFSPAELEMLAELFRRLPQSPGEPAACGPEDAG